MNGAVNLSGINNKTSMSAPNSGAAARLALPIWAGGGGAVLVLSALGAMAGGQKSALLAAASAFLGALLCAFAGLRSTNFPARRLGWLIVAVSLFIRFAGLLLAAKVEWLGTVLLTVQPLLLLLGLLFIARSAIVPQAAQPGEEASENAAPPFDWALAPDALVIGGAVSALLWWMLVAPSLRAAPPAARANLDGHYALLHHLLAAAHVAVLALLVIGRNELRPILHDAARGEGVPAPRWNIGWALTALGAFFLTVVAYRFFWLRGAPLSSFDVFSRVAAPLLIGVAALGESFQLVGQRPGMANSPLDPRAARAFWLRNFAPLLFAGVASIVAHRHFAAVSPKAAPLPGAAGEAWWGILLIAIALVRHAFDSLLITRQTFEDYRSWNDVTASLQHDVAARTRELSTMHAVAADLSNTLDSAHILTTALDRMMTALHADAGALWLFRGDEEERSTTLPLSGNAGGPENAAAQTPSGERRGEKRGGRRAEDAAEPVAARTSAASIRKALVESAIGQMMSGSRAEWIPKGKRWHLVLSGDDAEAPRGEMQRTALISLNNGLEQGDLENALIACRSLNNSFSGTFIVALQSKGEILGAMAVLRQKGALNQAEKTLMQSLALEVGAALQNAHLYQEAVRLADRDSLTDLLNHRAVQQQLNVCLARAARSRDQFVILMLDVNNFKFFNDTYGHTAGDEVLRRVAECLRQSCRISDVIGRYGGDEFIAILMDTDVEGARVVVNRLEEKTAEQALESSDGRRIPIGLSFAASIFPHDGESALDLLGVAGTNLIEAKHQGGGFVVRRHEEESEELKALKDAAVGGSFGVLDALVTAIDNKDNYTRRHSEDVARWAVMIARQLGYSQEQQRSIRMCGLLHDVGKIAVPDSILRKPGRLSDDEFKIMQAHPVFGALIVKDVPNVEEVLGGIRNHHERYDGRGYPDKTSGEDTPLFGRILAVPDCFSAMTTNRPYRQGLSWEEAIAEIVKGKGTQFDPVMADAFLAGIRELQAEEQALKDGKAPQHANTPEGAEAEEILQPESQMEEGGALGEGGYFMNVTNIKPRSVTDAELETAEPKPS